MLDFLPFFFISFLPSFLDSFGILAPLNFARSHAVRKRLKRAQVSDYRNYSTVPVTARRSRLNPDAVGCACTTACSEQGGASGCMYICMHVTCKRNAAGWSRRVVLHFVKGRNSWRFSTTISLPARIGYRFRGNVWIAVFFGINRCISLYTVLSRDKLRLSE